jgi:protein-L-isoaspartate O-methyltransferase
MDSSYVGTELELFQNANNWKKYWMESVGPYIGSNVLEVGAGIGTNSGLILSKFHSVSKLKCIEPDSRLSSQILKNVSKVDVSKCSVLTGFASDLDEAERFDTILYIDVIEHIEKDSLELESISKHLSLGGHLIVLVPAYQFLFSEFDKAIGHYRRYDKSMLRLSVPKYLAEKRLYYLDSLGLCASLANKMLLKQSNPTVDQVQLWDKLIVPISKITDVIVRKAFGKSLIGVWKKSKCS